MNQWDEDGAIQPMMGGHLPSLHMNPSLQVGREQPTGTKPLHHRITMSICMLVCQPPRASACTAEAAGWAGNCRPKSCCRHLCLWPAAQSTSFAMMDTRDLVPPAGLAGSSLRIPSGAGADAYAQFLRGAAGATRVQAPGLKTLSGVLPRMHVITNSDRSSMDFENNRVFTVRCDSVTRNRHPHQVQASNLPPQPMN